MSGFKVYKIILHVAAWLLFMALPLLFLNGGPYGSASNSLWVLKDSTYWVFCFTYISLFYINVYFLIPRLLLKRKYLQYSLITLLLFGCVYLLRPFDMLMRASITHWITEQFGEQAFNKQSERGFERWGERGGRTGGRDSVSKGERWEWRGAPGAGEHGVHEHGPAERGRGGRGRGEFGIGPRWYPMGYTSAFIFILIMALSTASKVVQQWKLTERRIAQAEADKASAELSFLKAQINPHFLFNTLNNIYSLILSGSGNAADSVMKLSNIMRYVTDDVTNNFVPLQSEIDCISDYIELQKLRIGKNSPVEFKITGNPANKVIAPLVMMTFIENVFKYGISKREHSPIYIEIAVLDLGITFYCENKIFINKGESENPSTGIGIKNTIQRLQHLYPNKYILNIESDSNEYKVNLTLQS
ncbi:MAG: histidine kinase [Sphingobacteriaceae bacterium]|nr:MAG: histidine kinase [Sphingobacteriaceae bacterium]